MSKNQRVSSSTLHTIGNTPMVQLQKVVPASSADVFIKLEYFNPTGSYKDRMALAMIEEAEARGDLRPGMTVVEYTGVVQAPLWPLFARSKGIRSRFTNQIYNRGI